MKKESNTNTSSFDTFIRCWFKKPFFFRRSRLEVFCKKGVLRNFAKFTGEYLCQSLFIKKETVIQVFSCEFCKIYKNTSGCCFCLKTPFHCVILKFEKKVVSFFHERVSCVKMELKSNSIESSTFLKYGLTEVKKAPS